MARTLWFEGAGWEKADSSQATDVGNCRIRTAFKDCCGIIIYLELLQGTNYVKNVGTGGWPYYGVVDAAYRIVGDDAANTGDNWVIPRNKKFNYAKQGILQLVNSIDNIEPFDEIQVSNYLMGYRVFKEGGGYNLGDEFVFDNELYQRRMEIYQRFYNLEQQEGKKFPNLSVWVDEENPTIAHMLRHFNGYNKHWIFDISTDDWMGTMKQTPLNSPGVHGVAE